MNLYRFLQQTVEQWRLVFIIAAANSIVGCIIYILVGSSEEQPWNQHGKLDRKERETQKIKAVKCDTKTESDNEKSSFIEEN